MQISFKNYIQIAGIIDFNEANLLIETGVQYLGFPLRLPVHKEEITDLEAAKIIRSLSIPHYGVLITYLDKAYDIIELCDFLGANIVQLHGEITLDELRLLKNLKQEIVIIKSLIVNNNLEGLKKIVNELSPLANAFITDTYDPKTGASGATGKTHDWQISKQLVELSTKPVILAGGLNPQNVREAILFVKPAGVDSHTGVENSDGRKDKKLVREFVTEAKSAFKELVTD